MRKKNKKTETPSPDKNLKKAAKADKKAAKADNILVASAALMKAARAYESLGDFASAEAAYKEIKTRFEGKMTGITDIDEIDKYIESASLKNGK